MLKEHLSSTRPGQGGRRWYSDDYFDLIVWIGADGSISGFQLCYDKNKAERALTWTKKEGYCHERVDDGEANPTKNLTPILVPDGACPIQELTEFFSSHSIEIDTAIRTFVLFCLHEYAGI